MPTNRITNISIGNIETKSDAIDIFGAIFALQLPLKKTVKIFPIWFPYNLNKHINSIPTNVAQAQCAYHSTSLINNLYGTQSAGNSLDKMIRSRLIIIRTQCKPRILLTRTIRLEDEQDKTIERQNGFVTLSTLHTHTQTTWHWTDWTGKDGTKQKDKTKKWIEWNVKTQNIAISFFQIFKMIQTEYNIVCVNFGTANAACFSAHTYYINGLAALPSQYLLGIRCSNIIKLSFVLNET